MRFGVLLFGVFHYLPLLSQVFTGSPEHFTIREGLSQSTVNRIAQDSLGFIWIATQDGLNRFDGYQFKVFKHDPEDSASISDNYFQDLKTDGNGNLWLLTSQGIDRFNPVTEKAVHYTPLLKQIPNWSPLQTSSLYIAPLNNLVFLGGSSGLIVLDPASGQVKRFQSQSGNPKSLISNSIHTVFEDPDGRIWIGTRQGVSQYFPQTEEFRFYPPPVLAAGNKKFAGGTLNSIHLDKKNQMWFAGSAGLHLFDRMTEQYYHFPVSIPPLSNGPAPSILDFTEDNSGNFWLLTYGAGLQIYSPASGKIIASVTVESSRKKLGSNFLNSIFRDRSGLIWTGSDGAGLTRFDPRKPKFHLITQETYPLSDPVSMSVVEDQKGNLWVGSFGAGITVFNPDKSVVTHLTAGPDPSRNLQSNQVMIIYPDKSGMIWIGTQDQGLARLNPETRRITRYPLPSIISPGSFAVMVISACETTSGDFLIGTTQGVFLYNREKDHFEPFKPGLLPSFPTNSIKEIGNTLYFSTDNGLVEMPVSGGRVKIRTHSDADNSTLSQNTVNYTGTDSENRIWVCTARGLNLYSPESGTFKRYFEKEGLPSSFIYGFLPDDAGNLWLSTNAGIVRFSPDKDKQNQIRVYDESDGLQSNEFNQGAFSIGQHTGYYYFGGINGINYFKPAEIADNPHIPPVIISGFKKLDSQENLLPYLNSDRILQISYQDYFFSFEFAALDFTNPGKNQYMYKLEGFDKDWIRTGSRRFITFTNLDPGNYVLWIRGSNNDGVWNEAGLKINLEIIPPYYKTTWFYLMVILVLIAIITGYIRYRALHLQRKNAELEILVREKTTQLSDSYEQLRISQEKLVQTEKMRVLGQLSSGIAHDINNILSIILGSASLLARRVKEEPQLQKVGIIEKAALDGAYIISRLQEFSKQQKENHLIKTDVYAILGDVIEMTSYKIADRNRKENIAITVQDNRKEIPPVLGNPSELRSGFNNLVLNAIDALETNGEIRISSSRKGRNHIQIRIEDTGIGMDEETQKRIFEPFFTTKGIKGSGLGLSQVFGTISRHNGTIEVQSNPGIGTVFTVLLPVYSENTPTEPDLIPPGQEEKHLNTRGSILVLEDEEEIRSIYQQILEDLQLHGIYAPTGEEALSVWDHDHDQISLIISDIGLPGISGWDFIREIRKTNQIIPILVITGWGNELHPQQIKDLSVTKVITKPFTLHQLVTEIQQILPE